MKIDSKIFVAGHNGMVGSAICRNLESRGYTNIIKKTSDELDLRNQKSVESFFKKNNPEYVFIAAAKVGGIGANNNYRADFIYDNLQIQNNIIHQSYVHNIKKLLFFGSSCIYPKNSLQPIKEDSLLSGFLEYTNEPYAIAKIAGIKMCENYFNQYGCNFISVMPTNLYGENDNYDLENSHVLPALIRKFHLAKCFENNNWDFIRKDFDIRPSKGFDSSFTNFQIQRFLENKGIKRNIFSDKKSNSFFSIKLWGSGNVFREFLHVDDMVDASMLVFDKINAIDLYEKLKLTHINIGSGEDLKLSVLAKKIKNIIGSDCKILWDKKKPDGVLKKQLDISILNQLKWGPKISLSDGIKKVYLDYVN